MNWFSWVVIVVGALLALVLVYELLQPKAARIRSGRRERDHGAALERGGVDPTSSAAKTDGFGPGF
ncbi:hypothetical protein ASE01_09990 [Nocardioides sp. Root190]|uniref:hypothetical protein n=1 Tax=Nocardioides sp. Root190 TaxID=1736488 RepID=UPI0006FB8047|nr:hypothetical protein [Nocardioides sp. Root190]KRB77077.1 hypothetical protein ASE01_09990 [Nocardioides sp. Root190]